MVSRMEANRHTSAAQRGNAGAVQHVGGWQVRGELAHAFPQLLASLTSQHEVWHVQNGHSKQRHRLFRTMRQEKRFQLLEAVGPLAEARGPGEKMLPALQAREGSVTRAQNDSPGRHRT